MTKRKFAQLLSAIDPALIAEAEESVPMRQKPKFRRAMVAAVASLLAMALLLGAAVIPFIPTTLELEYPVENGDMDFKNVWVYYTDENGRQKREYVRLPYSVQNVFAAWAHLSGLDESAQLLGIASDEGADADASVIVTLSCVLRDHPDADSLLDSLQKTFAKYYGMPEDNVAFSFSDASEFQPESTGLKFSHNLEHSAGIFMVGTVFQITATMTNISDEPLEFEGATTDFVPKAIIRMDSGDLEL